jgi:hypothetical protein
VPPRHTRRQRNPSGERIGLQVIRVGPHRQETALGKGRSVSRIRNCSLDARRARYLAFELAGARLPTQNAEGPITGSAFGEGWSDAGKRQELLDATETDLAAIAHPSTANPQTSQKMPDLEAALHKTHYRAQIMETTREVSRVGHEQHQRLKTGSRERAPMPWCVWTCAVTGDALYIPRCRCRTQVRSRRSKWDRQA